MPSLQGLALSPACAKGLLFSAGIVLGAVLFSAATPHFARAALPGTPAPGLGSHIVCLVFTDINQVGTPLPVLEGGTCPGDSIPVEQENTLALCSDGRDNDNNSFTDLQDPSCSAFIPPPPPPPDTTATSTPPVATSTPPIATTTPADTGGGETPPADTGGGTPPADNIGDTGGGTPPVSNGGGGTQSNGGGGGSISLSGGGGGFVPVVQTARVADPGLVLGMAVADCSKYLSGFIRVGAANDAAQVKRLQYVLTSFEGASLALSGVYDTSTLAAVNAFQAKYASEVLTPWGMNKPTGYVFLTTRKKINEVYCKGTKQFPLTESETQQVQAGKATVAPAPSTQKQGALGVVRGGQFIGTTATSTTLKVQSAWWGSVQSLFGRILGR